MDGGIANATSASDAPVMSDAQFESISEIALREFGLSMPNSKKPLVQSRLSKRIRELCLKDFDAYIKKCVGPGSSADELTKLLSALTTNVTHFFRENHHFELLSKEVLPPLIERARAGGRVRLWSAGCSSGQEAYSMAITLLESCPDASKLDIKILATDIDPAILERATAGTYPQDALTDEFRAIRNKYFDQNGSDELKVKSEVSRLVSFGQINLIAQWPVKGPFDVVFCRNVAIYFDKATQASVLKGFCNVLAPTGYLMIGHSERLSGPAASMLQSVGVTAYRMKDPAKSASTAESGPMTADKSRMGAGQ